MSVGVPAWVTGPVAALLLAVGAARLIRGTRSGRDIEATRIAMAAAMASMAVGAPLPWWGALAPVLAGCAWSAYRLYRARDPHAPHRVHHLLAGAAMAYLLAVPQRAAMPAMPMPGPTVPAPLLVGADLVLIGFFAGSAVLGALGATRLAGPVLPATAPAPRTDAACQVLMSLAMLAMVV